MANASLPLEEPPVSAPQFGHHAAAVKEAAPLVIIGGGQANHLAGIVDAVGSAGVVGARRT